MKFVLQTRNTCLLESVSHGRGSHILSQIPVSSGFTINSVDGGRNGQRAKIVLICELKNFVEDS